MRRWLASAVAVALLLGSATAHAAPTVTFGVVPGQGVGRGRPLDVTLSIASPILIRSVTATVAGRPVTMTLSPEGTYRGTFDTSPLPNGRADVVATVTDELNAVTTHPTFVILDDPPVPTVIGLRDHGLVTGSLRFFIGCTDAGLQPCTKVWSNASGETGSGAGVSVSLADKDGTRASIHVYAEDAAGIVTERVFDGVAVDKTPLTPVSRVPGEILKYDASRILYRSAAGLFVRDRATGTDTLVVSPSPPAENTYDATFELVDGGVTWRRYEGSKLPSGEWINGVLRDGVRSGPTNGVDVVFGDGALCKARNLATNVERTVLDLAAHPEWPRTCRGMAAHRNGDLIYVAETLSGVNYPRALLRVRGAVPELIFEPSVSSRSGVARVETDGAHVLTLETSYGGVQSPGFSITLDATGLSGGMGSERNDRFLGLLVEGYAAFVGSYPTSEVSLRKPDGTTELRSVWTTGAALAGLSASGEVAMGHEGRLYLRKLGEAPVDVGGDVGAVRALEGGWLIAQGDTLRCLRAPCGAVNPFPADPEPPNTPGGSSSGASGSSGSSGGGGSGGGGCSTAFGAELSLLGLAPLLIALRRRRSRSTCNVVR